MHSFNGRLLITLLLAVGLLASMALPAQPLDTAFTYQGRLKDGGVPANGSYDFEFVLWDADMAGS